METPGETERAEPMTHQKDLERILGTIGFDFAKVEWIVSLWTYERGLNEVGEKIGFDFPTMMEFIASETDNILGSRTTIEQ